MTSNPLIVTLRHFPPSDNINELLLSYTFPQELMKDLNEIALHKYGRKVLLYLLNPRDPQHFCPDIVKVLQQGDSNPHRYGFQD